MTTSPFDTEYHTVQLYNSFFDSMPYHTAGSPLGFHLWAGHKYLGWLEGNVILHTAPSSLRIELPRYTYQPNDQADDIPF